MHDDRMIRSRRKSAGPVWLILPFCFFHPGLLEMIGISVCVWANACAAVSAKASRFSILRVTDTGTSLSVSFGLSLASWALLSVPLWTGGGSGCRVEQDWSEELPTIRAARMQWN
jgi:hypothetical protein